MLEIIRMRLHLHSLVRCPYLADKVIGMREVAPQAFGQTWPAQMATFPSHARSRPNLIPDEIEIPLFKKRPALLRLRLCIFSAVLTWCLLIHLFIHFHILAHLP